MNAQLKMQRVSSVYIGIVGITFKSLHKSNPSHIQIHSENKQKNQRKERSKKNEQTINSIYYR